MPQQRAERWNRNVFINCPFDDAYGVCFEALVFTISASGYRVRCALEDENSARIRLDKLTSLIAKSDRSVHDLSWATAPEGDPARYNMPFELGLMIGARTWGGARQRRKNALVLIEGDQGLGPYLSDLSGVDPVCHHFDPDNVIEAVRNHLHQYPNGRLLPGRKYYRELLDQFRRDLPEILKELQLAPDEAHPIHGFKTYIHLLTEFLEIVESAAASGVRRTRSRST